MSMDSLLENPALKLIKLYGSNAAVGRQFSVSGEAVRMWLKNGIPAERALDVEDATRESAYPISAMEVLLFSKQQRDAGNGRDQAVQLSLPSA
jgi:hypothetical protein